MKTKKWRDVKNALVMVVVMAAMMSTATYAWFTLTSNATVTGMQMTAGGSSGLKVSKTVDGQYVDGISLAQEPVDGVEPENQVINQLTVSNNPTEGVFPVEFYTPVYGTNVEESVTGVIDLEQIADIANVPNYAAKYTYYLKLEDANTESKVGIVVGTKPSYSVESGLDGTVPKIAGSFVRETAQDTNSAVYAVRVGLVVNNQMYIWEPNNNGTVNGTEANEDSDMAARTYTATVSSSTTGEITDGQQQADGTYVSEGLFSVNGQQGTKVDMYVWLEGTDADCKDQIKADEIEAQIQFTTVAD